MMADASRNKVLAVVYASMAAGPIAIVTAAIGALLSAQPIAVGFGPSEIIPVIAGVIWFTVIAMIVALIPNVLGVTAMAWLASRNVGVRHPAMWALAGAAACGVPSWLLLGDSGQRWVAGWATTGALSALVARKCVRWEEAVAA